MTAARWLEDPLSFGCGDETLIGVLARPALETRVGVVIVVGGPQTHVGSHRQFVLLSRHLAAGGVPCFRFDVRGMGDSTGITRTLRTDLAAGRSVEVAGYMLSPSLANGLETAELMPTMPARGAGRLVWLEITSREPVALLPATAATIDGWRQAGFEVSARAVAGPAFWQTQEIEVAPALQAASTAHVLGSS